MVDHQVRPEQALLVSQIQLTDRRQPSRDKTGVPAPPDAVKTLYLYSKHP